jgi:C-terminal processing protease CtpA/Prc
MMIPSFDGDGLPSNYSLTFGHYANKIVSRAVADGRTKLIIDVSGNPGGNIDRAFNLFKLFFPSEFP